ncbi:MAG TPA: methylated-DNA--[protein]-cysteine S-methyltransferase [Phototrophicaceae bacterium]|nr:methylated-DNA--[protein]-cysteine S-methyltransferase [Phototrophicaceae bacterium]
MSAAHQATADTPDGPFTVLVGSGAVLASGWTDDVTVLLPLVHPSLRPDADNLLDGVAAPDEDGTTGRALAAVAAYYDGDLDAPGRVPVRQRSGEFRSHAWDVLRTVAAGERLTYTEYAARADRPAAVRAAAAACAANAAALFVPCHRVLRSDGSLGGFRYGLAVKARLLEREGSAPAGPALF